MAEQALFQAELLLGSNCSPNSNCTYIQVLDYRYIEFCVQPLGSGSDLARKSHEPVFVSLVLWGVKYIPLLAHMYGLATELAPMYLV